MDILGMGAELLRNSLGGQSGADTDALTGVLQKLIGEGDQLDLAGMIAAMQSGDLAAVAASWLGDGDNAAVSATQVRDMIGGDKIGAAAAELGTDENSLLAGLAKALPEMVDRSSRGGSLIDALGGLDGALNMAKKLF